MVVELRGPAAYPLVVMGRWLAAALVLTLPGSPAPAQDPKPVHGGSCPSECRACTDAVTRALDHLAGLQAQDGGIPGAPSQLRYVATDRHITTVFTSAITGLAMLANGSTLRAGKFKKHLAGIRDYLKARTAEIRAARSKAVGGGGGPVYASCLSLLYFVHLQDIGGDRTLKETIRELIDYLTDRMGTEVTKSCWKKGTTQDVVWYVSGVTAMLNSTIIALARARAAGFEVQDRIFDLAKKYYRDYAEPDGSLKYDQHNMFPHEPRPGRTIAGLLALKGMGVKVDKEYAPQVKYALEHINRTMSHHTPSWHFTICSFYFRGLGGEAWRKYVDLHVGALIARQKEDGSLATLWDIPKELLMKPNDTGFGPAYATANFALIMQAATDRVKFLADGREY